MSHDAGHAVTAARTRLRERQTALLAALVAGGPVPDGFDASALRVQARVLVVKRRATVAKVGQELPRLLGPGFDTLFLRYAREHPLTGGYHEDARRFAEWARSAVTDPEKRQALADWLRPRAPSPPAPSPPVRRRRWFRRSGAPADR